MSFGVNGKRSSRQFPWSKEYVEHLRATHFALIAASIGLIILVLTAKPYDARGALTQAQEVLQLKKIWHSDWVREKRESPASGPTLRPRNVNVGDNVDRNEKMLTFSRDVYVRVPGLDKVFRLQLKGDWLPDPQWRSDNEFVREFPADNLLELKSWWSRLKHDRSAAIVDELKQQCVVFDYSLSPTGSLGCSIVMTSRGHVETAETNYPRPVDGQFSAEAYLAGIPDHSEVGYYDEMSRTGYWFSAGHEDLLIRVYASYSIFKMNQSIVANVFPDWKRGAFETTFSDLSKASQGLELLPLEKLEEQLSDQVRKGGDTFDVFGLKIQAAQITTWGTALLLCIQIYLFMYLRQLPGEPKRDDSAWSVPWMALDSSWLGSSLFAFSLAAAVVATALLRYHAVYGKATGQHPTWSDWTWLFLPTIASLSLAVACWVHRPMKSGVEPESEPREQAE